MSIFSKLEELANEGYEITILNQSPESGTHLPKWGVSIFNYKKYVPGKSAQYAWDDKLETAIEVAVEKALNG